MDHEDGNDLTASIEYADAYYGGNSLKFRGDVEADTKSTITLYQADLPIGEDLSFTTAAKATAETDLRLVLTFADGEEEIIEADEKAIDDWSILTYDLSDYADQSIQTIGYEVEANEAAKGY